MNTKRILAFILMLSLAFSLALPAAAFADCDHDWDVANPIWSDPDADWSGGTAKLTFRCKNCEETTSVTANMTGMLTEQDASCGSGGYKSATFVADFNGASYSETLTWDVTEPSGERVFTSHFAANPATARAAGNSEYWQCAECGKFFSDANCTNEIAENSWVIPAWPAAQVTTVNAASKVPVYDMSLQPTGKVVDVANVYEFSAVETDDAVNAYYADWYCDYRVTLKDDVAADSFGLYGAFGEYNVAFTIPQGLPAGTSVLLLDYIGMTRTYSEILGEVGTFYCGAFNLSEGNANKSMTVDLVIWKGDSGEKVIATKTYDFSDLTTLVDPNYVPEATVTVDETTGAVTADIDEGFFAAQMDEETGAVQPVTIESAAAAVSVTFNAAAVESFAGENVSGSVKLTVEPTTPTAVEEDEKAVAYEIKLTDEQNNNVFDGSVAGASAEVTVPAPEAAAEGEQVAVYFVNGSERTRVGFAVVVNGKVTFSVKHFSIYEIVTTVALPTVNVTAVEHPNQAAPIKENLTDVTTGDEPKAALGCEYVFMTAPSQEQLDAYGSCYSDYTVSFSEAVAADSFGLYGKFGFYGNSYEAAFPFPADVAANTPVFLMESAGLAGINFSEVASIGSFDCGAFNRSFDNVGTVMTVSMVMWSEPDKSDLVVLDSRDYTFTAPATPKAKVTQLAPVAAADVYTSAARTAKLGTAYVPAVYNFAPDENSGVGSAAYEIFKDWYCDFAVSFDSPVYAQSFGLYGSYTNAQWGPFTNIAFLSPLDVAANTEVYLLETALGLDNRLSYDEVVNLVGSFDCGAFNLSDENLDVTMTVKLNMFQRDGEGNKINIITLGEESYTFDKHTYWTVEEVDYYHVPTGLSEDGKIIVDNALVDQINAGPHFIPENVKYTVQTVSDPANVATLTGGGDYPAGDTATVTAYLASGYNFVGWYKGDELLTTDRSYTFYPDDDVTLTAKYVAVLSFNLMVIGQNFTVDGVPGSGTVTKSCVAGSNHTVVYTGSDQFLYWVNQSDNIVSTSQTYKFDIVSNTELKAVSTQIEPTTPTVSLVFLNAYKQVIRSGVAADKFDINTIFPTTQPGKMGYTFDKWVIEESGEDATVANILSHCAVESPVLHIVPAYTKDTGSYTLTVYLVDESSENELKTLTANIGNKINVTKADVAAWASIGADEIGYWSLDGDSLTAVSYDEHYTALYATAGEYTLYAVKGVETATPLATITQQYAKYEGGKYKVCTTMKYYVPSDYTLVEAGFVYGTSPSVLGDGQADANLVLDHEKTYKSLNGSREKGGIYTFNGSIASPDKIVYIRAFVTYIKDGVPNTYYSPVVANSYNNLIG